MGPLVRATELAKALIDAGNNLLKPHSSTDATLSLLHEMESLLATVEQDPTPPVKKALHPSMQALVSADLLRNPDSDVRVFVVSCLTEIMRITAPDAPYDDNEMKEIFQVTIEAFGKLADASSRSYRKAEVVLETVAKVRSSLVMLDLECDDLVLEMFRQFLKIIRPDHPQLVLLSMETIMITVIDESEEVPMDLLEILLTSVRKESRDVSPAISTLVEKVFSSCASKLQPCIMEALKSTGTSLDMFSPVVSSICQSESATTQGHNDVKARENEADEKISEEQVVPSDLLEDKLNLGLSRKGNRSKRTARGGTHRANGHDKVITANEGQSESTDAETASGSTRKRGRKPNSLMNPEEGYSFKTSSSKKVQEKERGGSSLGKVAAKKASLPTKVGQTNQSVVISLSSPGRARTGSRKRSQTKMEETNHDGGSLATPASKKQNVKKDNPEDEDLLESNLEKPEDGAKTGKSSKKATPASKKQNVKKDNPEDEDLMESNLEKPEDGAKTGKSSKKATPASKKQNVKKDNPEDEDSMESNLEKPEDGAKTGKSSKKATPASKKQNVKKDNPEDEDLMESNLEKPEDGAKTGKSSKKATPASKKQNVKKDNPEDEDLMESNLEKPEDGAKTGKSSKKEKEQNGLAKTSAKKSLADTKMVKPSGKRKSVHSDAKKKSSEGASMDKPIPRSSKSKKKDSRSTSPLTKKSEQTPKSQPKRKRTAGEEVESKTNELGEELVGKKVSVWWPLEKKFYEGVIDSYHSCEKKHRVLYADGDVETLNLKKERFEIIQDNSSAIEDKEIDLSDSIPLSDFIQRKQAKKRKIVSMNVEPSSSPEVRSSMRTTKKKGSVTDFSKQAKRTKGATKAVSNEPESTKGKSLKSLKELTGESGKTKGRTGKNQKVTQSMHRESEKDCDKKEDPNIRGEEDSLKFGKESNAEPDSVEEHQELPKNQNAGTKTDGDEQKSAKEPNAEPDTDGKECNSLAEPNAEPKTDGEEHKVTKEPTAETKTDGEEHKVAKEPTAELETDEEEQKSVKEAQVEPTTDEEEQMSVKENAEPETKLEEKESGKEQTEGTKLIENEDMSEAKGHEIDNEAEEDDQSEIKDLKEESGKAEISTTVLQVDP